MESNRIGWIALALGLALAGTAHAAPTMTAGPVGVDDAPANGNTMACSVVNVSLKNVEVTITSVLDNTVVSSPGPLAPGEGATALNVNSGAGLATGYCVFEVKGGKKNVRASACALDASGNCRAALPAQ